MENMPRWAIYGGVAAIAVVGWFFLKSRSSASSSSGSGTVAPPNVQEAGYQSNATLDNTPWEMTWPYNQLALPYNYTPANANVVAANTFMVDPQSTDYPGYNNSVVSASSG